MNIGRLDRLWRRIRDEWQVFEQGLHYREGDYLAERISRLEKDVEAIKAALPSAASTNQAREST
jgi:hypothetical protein